MKLIKPKHPYAAHSNCYYFNERDLGLEKPENSVCILVTISRPGNATGFKPPQLQHYLVLATVNSLSHLGNYQLQPNYQHQPSGDNEQRHPPDCSAPTSAPHFTPLSKASHGISPPCCFPASTKREGGRSGGRQPSSPRTAPEP